MIIPCWGHQEYCVHFWAPQYKTDIYWRESNKELQRWWRGYRISQMKKVSERWDCVRWRSEGFRNLMAINTWGEGAKRTEPWYFLCQNKRRWTQEVLSGYEKTLIYSADDRTLHRLTRVESPLLKTFIRCLDEVQNILLWVSLLEEGLVQVAPEDPVNLSHSLILWFWLKRISRHFSGYKLYYCMWDPGESH